MREALQASVVAIAGLFVLVMPLNLLKSIFLVTFPDAIISAIFNIAMIIVWIAIFSNFRDAIEPILRQRRSLMSIGTIRSERDVIVVGGVDRFLTGSDSGKIPTIGADEIEDE
jgi:hypothetical protein